MASKKIVKKVLRRLGYDIVNFNYLKTLEARKNLDFSASNANDASASNVRITRKLVPAVNRPSRMCTAYAPPLDESKVSKWVAQNVLNFREKGVTVVPLDRDLAVQWRESIVFDRTVANLHSAWDWAGNSVASYTDALRAALPSASLKEDLRRIFSSDEFEQFFKSILGCPVTVVNCRLVHSLPHSHAGVGPQSWHEDGCPPGIIRGVLYLSDVDDQTGPFQHKDADGKIHTVLGKVGDLLIFDAMRLHHRALPPQQNSRIAIDLVFMPRLPGQELSVTTAGMNHWPADPFSYAVPHDKTIYRQAAAATNSEKSA